MAYILEVEYFNTFIVKGPNEEFHVEESRIKGGFNEQSVDLGVRAHATDQDYAQDVRKNAIIWSGIYNSKTKVNNTNQFPVGENITKAVDIQNGSIQLLFAEDTNLLIFQEEKVSRALIDKDAIYTAEGGRLTASSNTVVGEISSYSGNFGICTHPESFASFAGRKYFTDKAKGAVLRLSRDGLTEISRYGMRDYFRDNLRDATALHGSWDPHTDAYILTANRPSNSFTLSFDEESNGWTTFYSFINKEGGCSVDSRFFTFHQGDIYEHHSNAIYNNFYGTQYDSHIETVFNIEPSANKNFLVINYEGSDSWDINSIGTDTDTGANIAAFNINNQDLIISAFTRKDNKYFSNIFNASPPSSNEVSFGGDISGIKGYFMKVKIRSNSTLYKEIFSLSSNYYINNY